jgi:two-component system phosphate regulon response regulator PhoB
MVWGRHSEIDTRTVDVHIKRLREALNAVSLAASAQVQTIRSAGYRLSSQVAVPI